VDAFGEAQLEVFKYIHREIYPRFLKSRLNKRLHKRGKMAFELTNKSLLPMYSTLRIKPPESKILETVAKARGVRGNLGTSYKISSKGTTYEIVDILNDGILYNEYLQRLKQRSSAEFLLCARSINIYKDIFNTWMTLRDKMLPPTPMNSKLLSQTDDPKSTAQNVVKEEDVTAALEAVEDQAWLIYSYFLAKGASHQVTMTDKMTDSILRKLASPTLELFADLELTVMIELNGSLKEYKKHESYENWEQRALAHARNIIAVEARGGFAGRVRRWLKMKNKKVLAGK
jgi:hypothetical protein